MKTKIYHTSSISNVADIFLGGTPKRSNPEYWNGDIKWITAKDVSKCDSRYIMNSEEKITEKGLRNSAATLFNKDTIVITARGTVGAICMLRDSMAFNQSCYGIIAKENIIPSFLYYALKFSLNQIKNLSYGTVFDTITTKTFDSIKTPLPSFNEQKQISYILGSIDDKIELIQQINNTLELLCQTLFQHWFLDFEFPNEEGKPYKSSGGKMVESELAEIPKTWQFKKFSDIAEILSGGTPKTGITEYWNGDIKWISVVDTNQEPYIIETEKKITKLGSSKSNAKVLPYETIVISARGTVGNCAIMSEPMTINQSCYGLRGKGGIGQIFLFYILKANLKSFLTYVHGSVFDTITRTTFDAIEVIVPPIKLIDQFEVISRPFFDQILRNQFNIKILSEIRDLLLPKLMSGEIRV